MTAFSDRQPAIALVDDDFHSARLMSRMLAAHGGPVVTRLSDPDSAIDALTSLMGPVPTTSHCMAVIDLKSSSNATRDFIERLKDRAPDLLVVAMSPSLDQKTRNGLLDAGAAAVFERHADIDLYRQEAAQIVSFWVRNQRLDAVGA